MALKPTRALKGSDSNVCAIVVCAFAEIKFFCETPAIADIVILVDGSWSIGRFNFRLVRNFLENLVTAFNVGSEKTRIGIYYGP